MDELHSFFERIVYNKVRRELRKTLAESTVVDCDARDVYRNLVKYTFPSYNLTFSFYAEKQAIRCNIMRDGNIFREISLGEFSTVTEASILEYILSNYKAS